MNKEELKKDKFDFEGEEQYKSKTGEMKMLKDIFEQGKKEEKKKILVRVLDLLAYDWNNGSLVLLRDELKEKNE